MNSVQKAEVENTTESDVVNAAPAELKKIESNSAAVSSATKEKTIVNQGSVISLEYFKMGTNSSTMVVQKEEPTESNENLRVEVYRPIPPNKAIVELPKYELLAPPTYQAIVEEPQVEVLETSSIQVATIEEPTVEVVSDAAYTAVVEEFKLGMLKTADGDEIIVLSEEEEEDESPKVTHEIYESADEQDVNNNNNNSNSNNNDDDNPLSALEVIDSNCSAPAVRETETQTPKDRVAIRQRTRVTPTSSMGVMVGASSNYDSSEQLTQKLKVSSQPPNTFKQRQLELHRHRIAVEQKRLELLELKIARERDEMLRERILFEKELDLKIAKIRKFHEDRLDM